MNIASNPEEFRAELKIPKERIAVLIGKQGKIKRKLEKLTETRLEVDSKEGDVFIYGEDGLRIFEAKEVVKAVGRGFNPETAIKLLNMEHILDVVRMGDYATTKNSEIRLRGRVIGTEGKTRRLIENLSEAEISVYGKTIGIIGKPESVNMAKRAISMLLQGSPHSTVYSWLEKKRKTLKQVEFEARPDEEDW
jgi:ribosomal RNA assembly protein